MKIKELENELSVYVSEWLAARWQHWSFVNTSIHRDRRTGIYRLKQGEKLLDYLNSIMGIIEEHFGMDEGQHLIPSKFSSINQFAQFLQNFTQYLRDNYYLIETNFNKEQTDIIVADIANMVNEIIEMSNRCLDIILVDDNVPIPYQQVKKMRPLSEVATSDGRIDMVINCPKTIYIMEFKYSPNDKDLSKVALEQIKSKKYHLPYIIQQKPIVGIGYSFGEGTREITNYRDETLYVPGIILD